MSFEQFKSRYLLKLREQGLTTNDEEVRKMYIAFTIILEKVKKQ